MPLHEIDHPVAAAAQAVPLRRDAGGAERVVSLIDRVWFKVKTSDQRTVVTVLPDAERPDGLPAGIGSWWIGAAGHRQDDSPQRDFYAALRRESTTGTTVSTAHLLPAEWDWARLSAESALAWGRQTGRLVVRLVARSMTDSGLAVAQFQDHTINALVRADDEACPAITAEGIPDLRLFALLLDCVPGVAPGDWQPEPSPIAQMSPAPGEIAWSTVLPADVASTIRDLDATQ